MIFRLTRWYFFSSLRTKCPVTALVILLALSLVTSPQTQELRPHQTQNLPNFWKSRLSDIQAELMRVKTGRVEIAAVSPGGRPMFAVYYGKKDNFHSRANYNSAVAARNPAFYAKKDSTTKPVLFFLGPVHGQEVEGIVGLLNLIRVVETGSDFRGKAWPELQRKVEKCRVIIIPSANPDGRARCPYDSWVGRPTRTMTRFGQGTRKDGSLYGWPGAKAVHPMKGDVGILGAYFNDNGINPMHDDFFEPMADETRAILRIARSEAPDITVSLHSHENKPVILQANFVPWFMRKRITELSARVKKRFAREKLPYGSVAQPEIEDETPPPRKYFNLVSALHHISGSMSFTFECSHGTLSKQSSKPLVTHNQILDIQLCLYDEMLNYILKNRVYWNR